MRPLSDNLRRAEEVYALLSLHLTKKRESISLVPTENILSPLSSLPLATDLVNRYFLTDNTIWEYPQTQMIEEISNICDNVLKKLFNVKFVNTRPISGVNCMTVVIAALTKPGQTFYSVAPLDGGHGATSFIARRLGLTTFFLPFDKVELDIDFVNAQRVFDTYPPDFIYLDMSNFLFPLSLKQLRSMVPASTQIYFDCSQILGLILDDEYFNPLSEGFPFIGGSTHKTFPGPQKGVLLSRSSDIMNQIEPYSNSFISSHHVNSVVSLCIAGLEMLEFGKDYARQIIRNSKCLGSALSALDVKVEKRRNEFTGSHQLWIDPNPYGTEPTEVVHTLERHNIVANCARVPTIVGRGIRIGTTEITRLGMKEQEMAVIANLVVDVLFKRRASAKIISDVAKLSRAFPSPQYCFSCTNELLRKYKSII